MNNCDLLVTITVLILIPFSTGFLAVTAYVVYHEFIWWARYRLQKIKTRAIRKKLKAKMDAERLKKYSDE